MFVRKIIGIATAVLAATTASVTPVVAATPQSDVTTTMDADLLSQGTLQKIVKLKANRRKAFDAPGPSGDLFRYDTKSAYWSVVAVRPEEYLDTTLQVWGDEGQTELLGQSSYGSNLIDFVAVDSTHRPLDRYYPRVSSPTEYYDYTIEQAQGST